jgi:hypothetical protein
MLIRRRAKWVNATPWSHDDSAKCEEPSLNCSRLAHADTIVWTTIRGAVLALSRTLELDGERAIEAGEIDEPVPVGVDAGANHDTPGHGHLDSSARRDLSGGRSVMTIPTAIALGAIDQLRSAGVRTLRILDAGCPQPRPTAVDRKR